MGGRHRTVTSLTRLLPSQQQGVNLCCQQDCASTAIFLHRLSDSKRQKIQDEEQARQSLVEWSRQETKRLADGTQGFAGCCQGSTEPDEWDFRQVPFGRKELPMDVVSWVPPGTMIAKKALSLGRQVGGIRQILTSAWEERHKPIQHDRMPTCLQRPEEMQEPLSKCYLAGCCMCLLRHGDDGDDVDPYHLSDLLAKVLTKKLRRPPTKKGKPRPPPSLPRLLYDERKLFLRAYLGEPDSDTFNELWCHIGFGDLSGKSYTVFMMDFAERCDDGSIVLVAPEEEETAEMSLPSWFCGSGGSAADWVFEFWQLDCSHTRIDGPFAAGRVHLVSTGDPSCTWSLLGDTDSKKKRALPLRGLPDLPGQRRQPAPMPLQDTHSSSEDDWKKPIVRRAWQARYRQAWELEPSSGEEGGGGSDHGDEEGQVCGLEDGGGSEHGDEEGREGGLEDGGGSDHGDEEGQVDAENDKKGDSVGGKPKSPEKLHPPPLPPPPPVPPPPWPPSSGPSSPSPERRPRQHRASDEPRGKRKEPWGPFVLSKVFSRQVQVGWGATCKRHQNMGDDHTVQCKKQLPYGKRDKLDDHLCRILLKQWLLDGFYIEESDPLGRKHHLEVDPRHLNRDANEADLDASMQRLVDT